MDKIQRWYISPEDQLEVLKRINADRGWGFSEADFPPVPREPIALAWNEVLLLAVYFESTADKSGFQRTLDELWSLVPPPQGYTKLRHELLVPGQLRLASGCQHRPGIRWVIFNPFTFMGLSPKEAALRARVSGAVLAGLEVLAAALLFPEWAGSWNEFSPHPVMAGIQFLWPIEWRSSPYLVLERGARQLKFSARWDTYGAASAANPTVKELC